MQKNVISSFAVGEPGLGQQSFCKHKVISGLMFAAGCFGNTVFPKYWIRFAHIFVLGGFDVDFRH